MCLGGIVLHVIQKVLTTSKNMVEKLELQSNSNSITTNDSIVDDGMESNLPLLTQRSTSLTNLLNSNFSSDDDADDDGNKDKENTSQVLFDILQRREQS